MGAATHDPQQLNDHITSVKKRIHQQLARFIEPMVITAEMHKRGVKFIPSQCVKKSVRFAVYQLKKQGVAQLTNGNVILTAGGGFENARPMMKYHEQPIFAPQGNK